MSLLVVPWPAPQPKLYCCFHAGNDSCVPLLKQGTKPAVLPKQVQGQLCMPRHVAVSNDHGDVFSNPFCSQGSSGKAGGHGKKQYGSPVTDTEDGGHFSVGDG